MSAAVFGGKKRKKMSFFFAETMTYLLTHSSLQLVRKLILESAVRESFLNHTAGIIVQPLVNTRLQLPILADFKSRLKRSQEVLSQSSSMSRVPVS